MPPSRRTVSLSEPIEHIRKELRRNADAVIRHQDIGMLICCLELYDHGTMIASEFQSVREQVPNHLLQPRRISSDTHWLEWLLEFDTDLFCQGGGPYDFDRTFDNLV